MKSTPDYTIQCYHYGLGWVDTCYSQDEADAVGRARHFLRRKGHWSPGLRSVRVLKDNVGVVFTEMDYVA